MKRIFFTVTFATSTLIFAQQTEKETSEPCNIEAGFKEPKGESKNQGFLRKVDATTEDLKKHISIDRDCEISDITLLKLSEQKGNGIYILCIKGTKYKYRRSGSVFYRDGIENPYEQMNSGK